MTYKIKHLINGYRLGKEFTGKMLVAVRKDRDYEGIEHNGQFMPLTGLTPLTELKFDDQYGRGEYVLAYYEFKPMEQMSLL